MEQNVYIKYEIVDSMGHDFQLGGNSVFLAGLESDIDGQLDDVDGREPIFFYGFEVRFVDSGVST